MENGNTLWKNNYVLPGKIINAVDNGPAVSIIMPFNPKMSGKHLLEEKLKAAYSKIETVLYSNYPGKIARDVAEKLNATIKSIDYTTYKISLGIFVSPLVEKVFYLDVPVHEKVSVDEAFEIRDLIHNKSKQKEYLILAVTEHEAKIFKGEDNKLSRLVTNIHVKEAGIKNVEHKKAGHVGSVIEPDELELRKFLKHVDDGLRLVLNAYQLPLLIICNDKIKSYFKSYSKNLNRIVDFLPYHYPEAANAQIKIEAARHLKEWDKIIEKFLLLQIKNALDQNRISIGMKEVWKAAIQHMGRLLIVEKDFFSPVYAEEEGSLHFDEALKGRNYFIKDAVDVAIEKVLEEGGDVAFVENGLLKDYRHIVLIQFY